MTGDMEALKRISENRSFLMLVPFRGEPKPLHKARLAGAIMIISTIIATLNILPLEIVFLTGALVMILSGCISAQQAYQSIDARIFIFIAGAIPLGLAMQETGTADVLAGWLQGLVSGWAGGQRRSFARLSYPMGTRPLRDPEVPDQMKVRSLNIYVHSGSHYPICRRRSRLQNRQSGSRFP